MLFKCSYTLKQIEDAIRKENPNFSEEETRQKGLFLYYEIFKLDDAENKSNKRYWKRVQFSGDDTELDFYLQSKGICAGIDGQKTKLVAPKNVPVASRAD